MLKKNETFFNIFQIRLQKLKTKQTSNIIAWYFIFIDDTVFVIFAQNFSNFYKGIEKSLTDNNSLKTFWEVKN